MHLRSLRIKIFKFINLSNISIGSVNSVLLKPRINCSSFRDLSNKCCGNSFIFIYFKINIFNSFILSKVFSSILTTSVFNRNGEVSNFSSFLILPNFLMRYS